MNSKITYNILRLSLHLPDKYNKENKENKKNTGRIIYNETNCKVPYLSNKSPEWTPLVVSLRPATDEQIFKIATALYIPT